MEAINTTRKKEGKKEGKKSIGINRSRALHMYGFGTCGEWGNTDCDHEAEKKRPILKRSAGV